VRDGAYVRMKMKENPTVYYYGIFRQQPFERKGSYVEVPPDHTSKGTSFVLVVPSKLPSIEEITENEFLKKKLEGK